MSLINWASGVLLCAGLLHWSLKIPGYLCGENFKYTLGSLQKDWVCFGVLDSISENGKQKQKHKQTSKHNLLEQSLSYPTGDT